MTLTWYNFRNERHRLIKQLSGVIGKVQTFDGNKLHLPFQLPDQVCLFKSLLVIFLKVKF